MGVTEHITIIGTGNVASQLSKSFRKNGITISHVFGRDVYKANVLAEDIDAKICTSLVDLPNQLTILCVSDDAIKEVVENIDPKIPIAYTSGSVQISSLPQKENLGVFYPLQTITKDREINFFEVPIFIESNNDYFTQTLFDLAWKISRTVKYATSEERSKLHLAAVFVNNFTNHILHLAQELCIKEDVDFDHLRPLLKETIAKIDIHSAFDNQTGPAKRSDQVVIQSQMDKLNGTTKAVYEVITKSILKTYNK